VSDEPVVFLKVIFEGTSQPIELRALPSRDRIFTRLPCEIRKFVSAHARENLYFGCATRDGEGGKKTNCREVIVLWADMDFKGVPEAEARKRIASFPIPPTIVIESGGGFHVYWLLSAPESASDPRIEPVLRGLTEALGGDCSAAELARVLRLPGTLNFKYQPPRPVRILEMSCERRYALADFEKYAKRIQPQTMPGNAPGRICEGEKIRHPRRHTFLISLAGTLRAKGMDEAAITAALLAVNHEKCDPPKPDEEVREIGRAAGGYAPGGANWTKVNPWESAEGMDTFLSGEEADTEFLDDEKRFLARENVTQIYSPRGLGKSLFALWLAVLLASRGVRVLFLDRDNPRRTIKGRLRSFGATLETPNLKVITREKCPPLTNLVAWASFPYADYDVVFVDSLDSTAEAVGEQDSTKPAKAMAILLDIARREGGPAVFILGNTVKSGAHSRGCGVNEDRGDIVYEVRDASGLKPSGSKPWWEELPPADAASWADRASRRKQREKYRLAFVNSKFRPAEEPEPFVLEIDLTTKPWTVADVTDNVDREGAEARKLKAEDKARQKEAAVAALVTEISRRNAAKEPALLKKQTEEFLAHLPGVKITQTVAREIINSEKFAILKGEGKGHPRIVQLPGKKEESNRNSEVTEGAKTQGENGADFGGPQSMPSTEIDSSQVSINSGSGKGPISVNDSLFTPHKEAKSDGMQKPTNGEGRSPWEPL
jgi:hypothetical protein